MSIIQEKVEDLVTKYYNLQEEILENLEKLPNFGSDCNCDEPTRFSCEDDDNLTSYCMNCGGTLEW